MIQRLTGGQYFTEAEHFNFHQGNASCNGKGFFSHSFDLEPVHIIIELGRAAEGTVSRMVFFNGIADGMAELRLSEEGVECSMFLQGPASCSHSDMRVCVEIGITITNGVPVPAMEVEYKCRWCGKRLAEVRAQVEPKEMLVGW